MNISPVWRSKVPSADFALFDFLIKIDSLICILYHIKNLEIFVDYFFHNQENKKVPSADRHFVWRRKVPSAAVSECLANSGKSPIYCRNIIFLDIYHEECVYAML